MPNCLVKKVNGTITVSVSEINLQWIKFLSSTFSCKNNVYSGQGDGVIRGGSNGHVQAGRRLSFLQESSNFVESVTLPWGETRCWMKNSKFENIS